MPGTPCGVAFGLPRHARSPACSPAVPPAPGAGHHGREYSAGGFLRPAVRAGQRPPLRDQTLGEGSGADGVHGGSAARRRAGAPDRILRRDESGRCRDRHGQRQCQPLFPLPLREYSVAAAGEPPVGGGTFRA